jgi:hypothetical protein
MRLHTGLNVLSVSNVGFTIADLPESMECSA